MIKHKIECKNGWIVFIIVGHQVAQIHSTGKVTEGIDDRSSGIDLLPMLINDAMNNDLHSQSPGKSGVRWPED